MKVLIVNTYDHGGAANACLRLHEGLLRNGVESSILFKNKQQNICNSQILIPTPPVRSQYQKVARKIYNVLRELKLVKKTPLSLEAVFLKDRNKELELFSFPHSNFDITSSKLYEEADIINLHWVAGFLDYETFFKKNNKPVVWTLHDMNPFTGGEHYEEIFLGIDEAGLPIQRIQTEEEIKVSSKNKALLNHILKNVNNLSVVAPSQWLANEAKKSEAYKDKPIKCIPYGLDSEIFKNRDRDYSRQLFNIPKGKKVILFVADSISNNRKGFIYLKTAFEKLERDDVLLCAIGNKNESLSTINNIMELGPMYDERLMSIAYSAADAFVIPSLMDNLPNTVLESLMCGTPVIGFPVGGITDMVQPGVNGLLTENISVDALLVSLNNFLDSLETFNREHIRRKAVAKYDLNIQATAYTHLFEDILHKGN